MKVFRAENSSFAFRRMSLAGPSSVKQFGILFLGKEPEHMEGITMGRAYVSDHNFVTFPIFMESRGSKDSILLDGQLY